jgi:hypothetical protein
MSEKSGSVKGPGLTVFFGCALALLGSCLPAIAGTSYSTSASVVDTGGCVNSSVGPSQTTSAVVSQPGAPLPVACTGGGSNGDSVRYGAVAGSNGVLSVLAEYASIGGLVTTPISMTSTATLTDTLTFSCAGCTPGELLGTATLLATLDGGILNEFIAGNNADAYASYTATVSDPTDSVSATTTAEFCPAPPATNCTVNSAAATNRLPVPLTFALYAGDSYSVSISLTAFVELIDGDTSGEQLLAGMNDPLGLTLPNGVVYSSASGDFLPEPSSWVLVGSGLTLCLLRLRRWPARK